MASPYYGGIGAFMSGLSRGAQQGQQLVDMYDKAEDRKERQKVEAIYSQGIEGAKKRRNQDIESQIQTVAQEGTDPVFKGPSGQTYKSREQARKAIEKDADDLMTYFMRDAAPKVSETLMSQGRVQEASQWDEWVQNRSTQKGMKHWAKALRSAQVGDWDGMADSLSDAYNSPGYLDDGMTVKDHKLVKGEDGSVAGIEMTFQDPDGKEFSQTFNEGNLAQVGLGLLSPQSVYKQYAAQQQKEAEMRAESESSKAEAKRDFAYERAGARDDQRLEMETARFKAQLEKKYGTGDAPAKVKTAKWLMENGVAKDADDAWRLQNLATQQSENDFAMEYAKVAQKAQEDSFLGDNKKSVKELMQEGRQVYREFNQ